LQEGTNGVGQGQQGRKASTKYAGKSRNENQKPLAFNTTNFFTCNALARWGGRVVGKKGGANGMALRLTIITEFYRRWEDVEIQHMPMPKFKGRESGEKKRKKGWQKRRPKCAQSEKQIPRTMGRTPRRDRNRAEKKKKKKKKEEKKKKEKKKKKKKKKKEKKGKKREVAGRKRTVGVRT